MHAQLLTGTRGSWTRSASSAAAKRGGADPDALAAVPQLSRATEARRSMSRDPWRCRSQGDRHPTS